MENFNETLKNYLAGQGMTQGKVAEKIGLSRTIVSNYLNGQRRFGKLSAHRWSEAFNIDPVWLMTEGEKGTPPDGVIQFVTPTTPPDIINIPILSLDARGGFLPNDKADIDQYTIGTMPFNRQIAHTGDVVIPVYGDSMTPKYPAGSFILIRPIEAIVRKGSDSTHYTLDSYNVDYESNEVAISFINNMWLVVASVNREEL